MAGLQFRDGSFSEGRLVAGDAVVGKTLKPL
jgi:hypothetical protein